MLLPKRSKLNSNSSLAGYIRILALNYVTFAVFSRHKLRAYFHRSIGIRCARHSSEKSRASQWLQSRTQFIISNMSAIPPHTMETLLLGRHPSSRISNVKCSLMWRDCMYFANASSFRFIPDYISPHITVDFATVVIWIMYACLAVSLRDSSNL